MLTYGKTACPKCTSSNNMYRSMAVCKHIPSWDKVTCWNCHHKYKHSDKLNNVPETEAERVRREGQD